jgi:sugar lactone lactonase YvrE
MPVWKIRRRVYSYPRRAQGMRDTLAAIVLALAVLSSGRADTQSIIEPNSQPNPYKLVMNWAELPADMKWGQVIAFDIDRDGNIYVFHRNDPGILKFSPAGKLLKSWGEGLFVQAHGITVDRFGFIWTADSDAKDGKGGQVLKWDANGRLLMALGKKGVLEESPTGEAFVGPTGVAVAANGDIFVTDGHNPAQHGNHRVVRFSKEGKFIRSWGNHTGSANGEVDDPHGIAMDSRGRLFVADRGNRRIDLFDQDGRFLEAWTQFGTPENIYITSDDTLFLTCSANPGGRNPTPYQRGIRVGSAKDGSVKYFIPDDGAAGPVGLGADTKGNIYAADVGMTVGFDKMMKKYVRQ